MSDHLPVLKVRLFGGFSASYGEIPVSFGRNTTTKAMKLLQILLYHGDTGISRDKLLDEHVRKRRTCRCCQQPSGNRTPS